MTPKPKKTTAELISLIMEEIRKHPECDNITGVGTLHVQFRLPRIIQIGHLLGQ